MYDTADIIKKRLDIEARIKAAEVALIPIRAELESLQHECPHAHRARWAEQIDFDGGMVNMFECHDCGKKSVTY